MQDPSTFTRFVEVGRVVLLKSGPFDGKIATIVEIMDHNRVSAWLLSGDGLRMWAHRRIEES
jgi:transcription antitermination factor NusG